MYMNCTQIPNVRCPHIKYAWSIFSVKSFRVIEDDLNQSQNSFRCPSCKLLETYQCSTLSLFIISFFWRSFFLSSTPFPKSFFCLSFMNKHLIFFENDLTFNFFLSLLPEIEIKSREPKNQKSIPVNLQDYPHPMGCRDF